jgi:hypothetical protein
MVKAAADAALVTKRRRDGMPCAVLIAILPGGRLDAITRRLRREPGEASLAAVLAASERLPLRQDPRSG